MGQLANGFVLRIFDNQILSEMISTIKIKDFNNSNIFNNVIRPETDLISS